MICPINEVLSRVWMIESYNFFKWQRLSFLSRFPKNVFVPKKFHDWFFLVDSKTRTLPFFCWGGAPFPLYLWGHFQLSSSLCRQVWSTDLTQLPNSYNFAVKPATNSSCWMHTRDNVVLCFQSLYQLDHTTRRKHFQKKMLVLF